MTSPIRIPADVDLSDRVLGPLTARQLAILGVTGLVLYATWTVTRAFLPAPVFGVLAVPIGTAAAVLALGRRDGVSLDRLVLAALRQRLQPRHRVAAPEGVRPAPDWLTAHTTAGRGRTRAAGEASASERVSPSALRLPAEAVTDTGVVDLGSDGLAVVAACSTVNFALRTPAEQGALVASFSRYLHSLTAPVQVLVRTERLDLSGQITELREQAGGLPHPALETAAREHADYLAQLGEHTDLLRRQVLLVLREPLAVVGAASTDGLSRPGPRAVLSTLTRRTRRRTDPTRRRGTSAARRAAESRLVRRLGEAVELLSPAGIVVTPLDAGQATAVLASACNPDTLVPPTAGLAGADDIITSPGGPHTDPDPHGWSGQDAPRPNHQTHDHPTYGTPGDWPHNWDTPDNINDFDDDVDEDVDRVDDFDDGADGEDSLEDLLERGRQ